RAGAAAAAGEEAGAAGAAAAGDEAGAGAAAAGDEAGAAAGAEVACAARGFELAGPGACADPQAASAGSSNARAARQGISGDRKGEWWRRWDRMETSSSSSNEWSIEPWTVGYPEIINPEQRTPPERLLRRTAAAPAGLSAGTRYCRCSRARPAPTRSDPSSRG